MLVNNICQASHTHRSSVPASSRIFSNLQQSCRVTPIRRRWLSLEITTLCDANVKLNDVGPVSPPKQPDTEPIINIWCNPVRWLHHSDRIIQSNSQALAVHATILALHPMSILRGSGCGGLHSPGDPSCALRVHSARHPASNASRSASPRPSNLFQSGRIEPCRR